MEVIVSARKSSHRFENATEEVNALIENFIPQLSVMGPLGQAYFFNYTSPAPPALREIFEEKC